jgi:hypothetical protein
MAGNQNIVAIDPELQDAASLERSEIAAESEPITDDYQWDAEEPAPPRAAWRDKVLPGLAILLALGWTVFFVWTNRSIMLVPATPQAWLGWIRDWSLPVILVCCLWLIAMRNSRREAERFGATARMLSEESTRLEARLSTINGELSLAREFIAAQARDLEALGRMASERLSSNADRLASLIAENGTRIETIGTVSENALDNMEKLRGQLPVIASAAKDVTNNIGNAGRTAHAQLEDMVKGFTKLNQFGQASETQVIALRGMVEKTLSEFTRQSEQLGSIAEQRFATLTEQGAEFRSELDSHEVSALAAIRTRATALGEEIAETRAALDTQEAESLTSLRARLTTVRDESSAIGRSVRETETQAISAWQDSIARLEEELRQAIAKVGDIDAKAMESARLRLAELTREAAEVDDRFAERDRVFGEDIERREAEANARHEAQVAALVGQLASLDAKLGERAATQAAQSEQVANQTNEIEAKLGQFAERMDEIARHGAAAEAGIAVSLSALAERLVASREALAGTDTAVNALTENSVRLLELIQGSAKHTTEELPKALSLTEERLAHVEQRAAALRDVASEAEQHGERLSAHVLASKQELAESGAAVEALHRLVADRSAEQGEAVAKLRASLAELDGESRALADHADNTLRTAIEALGSSARDAVAGIEQMSASAITALAERLGAESGDAIDKVLRARTAEATGQLEQAAAHASGISREAAVQLRDQLTKVNELAGNLERRVNQARARAEEQVDNDFARRVALITEALNSNAIDIARVLDTDVTDTAWASYLKGDRGVFTRRAVRLLDASEAKAVMQVFTNDDSFREHVSRYIHDFEAMLRQLLSTRDGHALGVTLLSSDMGKLYVALAQAIERLRN